MTMIDILSFEPVKAGSKGAAGAASISIVNTEGNGKRIKLSKKALGLMGNPEKVQISVLSDYVAVAAHLPNADNYFNFGKGGVIYNAPLVETITKAGNLDFENGKTSFSFGVTEEQTLEDGTIVLIFKIG